MMPCRLFFVVLLLGMDPAPAAADEAGLSANEPTALSDPSTAYTVRLSPARQQAGGLVVEPLQPVTVRPEILAYGKVQDIQPLLNLRMRYRAAEADAAVTAAALELARKNRDRIATLHREKIIAGRELVQAETQLAADQAKNDAARRLLDEIRREAQQSWGGAVTHLALDGNSALFEALSSHRRWLLLVALPSGRSLPPETRQVKIGRDNAEAVDAELVSPAPRTDDLVQGETWFFQGSGPHLRTGMRLNVRVPVQGRADEGIAIPLAAVVWHSGKPWAYRRTSPDTFVRREITGYRDQGATWFVQQGFAPGENLVVTGAQMLLSEEFRGQIPDEDAD